MNEKIWRAKMQNKSKEQREQNATFDLLFFAYAICHKLKLHFL